MQSLTFYINNWIFYDLLHIKNKAFSVSLKYLSKKYEVFRRVKFHCRMFFHIKFRHKKFHRRKFCCMEFSPRLNFDARVFRCVQFRHYKFHCRKFCRMKFSQQFFFLRWISPREISLILKTLFMHFCPIKLRSFFA